jgi:hypothetical protein
METTTTAKKNLNPARKKVVICQIYGNSKILVSDKSNVKNPKKLILIEERIKIDNGKIKEISTNILLVLLSQSF